MALEALQQVVRNEATSDNETLSDLNARANSPEGMLAIHARGEGDEADSIPRLKGRSILAESNIAVAQKRLNDFERARPLYSFEIDSEQWSLVSVDRQQGIKESQIDYSKRAISAYRKRLYGAINNPLKLYGLRDYKQNAATAKEQIKNTRLQIDGLRQIREAVTSCLDNRRVGLQTEVRTETESWQRLNQSLELQLGVHSISGKEITPEFAEKELDRFEANARFLRDPKLLQTFYQYLEGHYGTTAKGMQTIAARAGETLEFAKACLANVNDGIRAFGENREFVPVLFKGANGEEQTTTVSEVNKPTDGRNVFSRIFNEPILPPERVNEALKQRERDLLQEHTTIKSFVDAASDIANRYLQTLTANVRTEIATLSHRTESYDEKDFTQPHWTNADEHLKEMRQTIDKLSLQTAAANETGIEAGIAEAESAASESLAALI
jgi:hypothetical protein